MHEVKTCKLSFISSAKLFIAVLYVYACWYVQTFSNISIVVKGATVGIMVLFFLHIMVEGGIIRLSYVPYGVWTNLIIAAYSLVTGLFTAYDLSDMLNSLIIFIGYSMAVVVICYISTEMNSIDWFMNIVIFTALLCGIYALFQNYRYCYYGLCLSDHNNIHTFALVETFGIFALAYKSRDTAKSLVLHLVPAMFLLYCIIESSSRKCFLGAILLIALWLYTVLRKLWKDGTSGTRTAILVAVVLATAVCAKVFLEYFVNSMTFSRFQTFTDEDSNTSRLEMYRMGFEIFLEKPLFGGGFDQFKFWSGRGSYSHAVIAESVADFGLVGTALYFTPVVVTTLRLYRAVLSKSRSYKCCIAFALLGSELLIGLGQIFFLEPQHIFIFAALYWIEMNEMGQQRYPTTKPEK